MALVLAAGALVVGGTRSSVRRRIPIRSEPIAEPSRRPALIRLVAVLGGLAVAVVVGGWVGPALGMAAAFALDRGLARLEPQSVRAERAAVVAALPFAADLLGAVLRSGAPTPHAVARVAAAIGGPLGQRLELVARGLDLGSPPAEAWDVLAEVPEAASLVRAAVRASESGAALAGACARFAAELRAGHEATAEAAARRAGVLVVLPLGCCFLPAFVLLGVVPIVLGVLDGVLR